MVQVSNTYESVFLTEVQKANCLMPNHFFSCCQLLRWYRRKVVICRCILENERFLADKTVQNLAANYLDTIDVKL